MSTADQLMDVYDRLLAQFGPQHWWPGDTPFEVCVGAILTQNTAWTNVEKAITNLKRAWVLDASAMLSIDDDELAELIRPSGYFNLKAKRLKGFLNFLDQEADGDLDALFAEPLEILRPKLLGVYGIGPETADSILLYAASKPSFVVDAYTMRIFSRLGIVDAGTSYHAMQSLFMDNLPQDVALYNEYHALIVALGKDFCRPKRPKCEGCWMGSGDGFSPICGVGLAGKSST
jgi:endonuclease-3 related protein